MEIKSNRYVDQQFFFSRLSSVFNRQYDKIKVRKRTKENEQLTSTIFGFGCINGIEGAFVSHKSPVIAVVDCVVVGIGLPIPKTSSRRDG